ncbi:MAG: hypothetical protein ACREM3_23825 [Candidatus Rokuibacteriota bacterium]
MERATVTMARTRPTFPAAMRSLFKADHQRTIDGYIDYFGGPAREDRGGDDACGETLLDALARCGEGGRHVSLAS